MIEIENFVTRKRVEHAYSLVMRVRRESKSMSIPSQGMRIAKHRDSSDGAKLLVALEKSAEILHAIAEEQSGRTRRDSLTSFAERVEPTEAALYRAAYETMDKGEPDPAFAWIYGAAGIVAGLVIH